jgi:hypothetical protein
MKTSPLLFSLFLLSACGHLPKTVTTTQVPIVAVPGTSIPPQSVESVRYPEELKEYTFGRYEDPNDPRLMHGKSKAYRVEQDAAWNLHPNPSDDLPSGPTVEVADPARSPNPYTAELEEEFKRQQSHTGALIQQNDALLKRLESLDQQTQRIDSVLQENQQLRDTLKSTSVTVHQLQNRFEEDKRARETQTSTSWWSRFKALLP